MSCCIKAACSLYSLSEHWSLFIVPTNPKLLSRNKPQTSFVFFCCLNFAVFPDFRFNLPLWYFSSSCLPGFNLFWITDFDSALRSWLGSWSKLLQLLNELNLYRSFPSNNGYTMHSIIDLSFTLYCTLTHNALANMRHCGTMIRYFYVVPLAVQESIHIPVQAEQEKTNKEPTTQQPQLSNTIFHTTSWDRNAHSYFCFHGLPK